MAKRKQPKFSDQLRQAVIDCGLTRAEISRRTGLGEGQLARFVHGERDISLRSVDLLAECLNLGVTTDPKAKRGR